MKMKKRTRFIIFLFCLLFGGYFILPTIQWYFWYKPEDRNEAGLSGAKLKVEISKKVEEAVEKLKKDELSEKEYKAVYKEYVKEVKKVNSIREKENKEAKKINKDNPEEIEIKKKFPIKDKYTYSEMSKFLLILEGKEEKVNNFFKKIFEDYFLASIEKKAKTKGNIIKLGLDLQGGALAVVDINFSHPDILEKYPKEEYPNGIPSKDKDDMIDKAIEHIKNRIDKYGLSEISIQKMREQEKIIISLPGVKEVTELRQIIETVGVLEFKLVSKTGSDVLYNLVEKYQKSNKKYLKNDKEFTEEFITELNSMHEGVDIQPLFITDRDKWGIEKENKKYLAVESKSLLGKDLKITGANVQSDNYGRNVVTFELDQKGAKTWSEVTELAAKDKRQIAIILDDVILTYPLVKEKIPTGRSQIELGNAPLEQLETLALILRTGSMNVPLEIIEEQTVGASLGRDTIEKGLFAVLLGFILVLLFMVIWYSGGGLIADIAMVLNFILMVGALGLFKATLTLPGIAGIILTVGMAVDANVIIYERIKEEFRTGKTFKTSLNLGFNKAFWTILDANLTTFAAGLGLSFFGTGPIKGFAVTLCVGIIISLFTSLFVSRLIFDSLISVKEFKSLRVLSLPAFFRGN